MLSHRAARRSTRLTGATRLTMKAEFSLNPSISAAKGYLVDLDGTLMSGGQLLPEADTLLGLLQNRFVIVSNDSEHTPSQLERKFRQWNLKIPADRILLAGTCALETIARRQPGARILIIGSTVLRRHAQKLGLVPDAARPQAVLVARDRRFTFERLYNAVNAVRAGAELYVACPDRTHPAPNGGLFPEAGALAAAIFACVGDVPHHVVGKPETALFHMGCERLRVAPIDAVMIGDNPLTDAAGAARAGLRFLQVEPNRPQSAIRFWRD